MNRTLEHALSLAVVTGFVAFLLTLAGMMQP